MTEAEPTEQLLQSAPKRRIQSVDSFRGLAVVIMVWSHTLTTFAWEYANPTQGILVLIFADWMSAIAAPIFFLTIGMAFTFSVENRRKKGHSEKSIFIHQFKRVLFLVGIAYLINFTLSLWELTIFFSSPYEIYLQLWLRALDWMIFHAIGLFILCLYFISRLSQKSKLVVLVGLLAGTFIVSHFFPLILSMALGSPYAPYNMFFNLWAGVQHVDYVALLLQGNVLLIIGGLLSSILFWGQFPLFPWLAFCVIGLFLGQYIRDFQQEKDQHRLKKSILTWSIVLLIIGFGAEFISWIWAPLFIDPVFYMTSMSACSILIFYGLVLQVDINDYDWKGYEWTRALGRLPLTVLVVHNNVFLNIIYFLSVMGIPIMNQAFFPFFLFPVVGTTGLFYLMAILWEKKDYKYSLEWIQSKL